ncbi:MAG: zinc ABC transporter substrate-binding protein [Oscillospiraceae bacterium]|nr:zinc ABC transporter substrate-binding protein [Oscillospiraceae bacterium]
MKRIFSLILLCALALAGCAAKEPPAQIAATTLPVYEFTSRLCQGTDLTVTRLVTEEVSCLHDYSLNVRQVKAAEAADVIIISGAGLEEFMEDLLAGKEAIDASEDIALLCPEEGHDHTHEEHDHEHDGHHHDQDPHLWLSPLHARDMAFNIWKGLCEQYPDHAEIFTENLHGLRAELDELYFYGREQLENLSCRDLITFHDGFAYFAQAFDLHILEAVEEESGSEDSAKELIHLIEEVEHHDLPAIFTEKSGSVSAAGIIARETGCGTFQLDMAMAGDSYFEAMYHNIDTIKEALG